MQNGWRYYNHALIPTTAPHEPVRNFEHGFWKNSLGGGIALFARWTEDFDCEREMPWWYVIKDTPFDINDLKAKRRYEIRKGQKNFDVRIISAEDYSEELYKITADAYTQYPEKYRPVVEHNSFIRGLKAWKKYRVYGAFNRENDKLCGYAWVNIHSSYIDFTCMKVSPEYERYGINAAIVCEILNSFEKQLENGIYICDGARASIHETNFQDYLEKYFGFRKAYCRLKMKYRFPIGLIVSILYPLRNQLENDGKISSKISNVLFYEKIARECK